MIGSPVWTWLAILGLATLVRADRVVDRYGKVTVADSVEIEADQCRAGKTVIPLSQVYLAESDDGTLLYAPSLEHRLRAYESLVNTELRREYMRLAMSASQVGDMRLARSALRRAEKAGLSGKELTRVKIAFQKRSRGSTTSDRLRGKSAELDARYGQLLAQRAALELKQKNSESGYAILSAALERAPNDPLASQLLAEHAPKEFPLGDARSWLSWKLALRSSGGRIVSDGTRLERARSLWRRDLHAIEAGPIRFITPLRDSRLAGRCLSYGTLACRALSNLFPAPKDAPARALMTAYLYESKKEYLSVSGTERPIMRPEFLKWSAGYYSPSERVSRFYWYADLMAERRIVGTFMHELTHQWLAEQNLQLPNGSQRSSAAPGYWIVEGIANFMEEGQYDIERDSYSLSNPHARSIDSVDALRKKNALIPWKLFYGLDQRTAQSLGKKSKVTVALRWHLIPGKLSEFSIFYEQSAATCHFLYRGEGGRHRKALMDFVVRYYSGDPSTSDLKAAFGLTPEELGAKVELFCKTGA